MRHNSLTTKQTGTNSPATARGPKPGDFVLGSAESRAAARARVRRLAEQDGPQPGDIFIDVDVGFLTRERAAEIYRVIHSPRESREAFNRTPGEPKTWFKFKFPAGFDPNSLPESTPPLTLDNAPEDLLTDLLRCYNEGLRKAKQSGQSLPPHLDPDLVWNGMVYVPKQTVPKVAG